MLVINYLQVLLLGTFLGLCYIKALDSKLLGTCIAVVGASTGFFIYQVQPRFSFLGVTFVLAFLLTSSIVNYVLIRKNYLLLDRDQK